jgi:hypothetical protein
MEIQIILSVMHVLHGFTQIGVDFNIKPYTRNVNISFQLAKSNKPILWLNTLDEYHIVFINNIKIKFIKKFYLMSNVQIPVFLTITDKSIIGL